jgi:hypothetical protein
VGRRLVRRLSLKTVRAHSENALKPRMVEGLVPFQAKTAGVLALSALSLRRMLALVATIDFGHSSPTAADTEVAGSKQ